MTYSVLPRKFPKSTEAHGSCDAHIEYVPTNAKGYHYPCVVNSIRRKVLVNGLNGQLKKKTKSICRFKATTIQTQNKPLCQSASEIRLTTLTRKIYEKYY
jgi:hypothetical protein